MISIQQMMIKAKDSYFQCLCDKAFMNQAFLQLYHHHHPDDLHPKCKRNAQTDQLQNEMDVLQEELQLRSVR